MLTTRRPNGGAARLTALLAVVIFAMVAAAVALRDRSPTGTFADAVAGDDVELAEALAATGADPDFPTVFGLTPLMRAVNRNLVEMAEVLIAAGADLHATDQEGLSPVHVAAQADAAESLVLLARAGADLEHTSRNGMAPIHHAAATGSIRALRALVDLGVSPEMPSMAVTQGHGYPRDLGATPLGIAAREGHALAVATLLELGAAVDGPSASGHTPLLLAVFAGAPSQVVETLLDAGADPSIVARCELGCSVAAADALGWAHELDRTDSIPLLAAAGE